MRGVNAKEPQPPVTLAILALCAVVFVLEVMASPPPWNRAVNDVSIDALVLLGGNARDLTVTNGEWWRLMAAVLLHGNIAHIGLNGWNLYAIGASLERRAGGGTVLSGFVWTGLLASVVSSFFGAPNSVSVGASGAVFGLFGFLATHGVQTFAQWVQQIRLNAVRLALVVAVSALIPNVDNSAHVGGLLSGLALGFFWERLPKAVQSTSGALAALALAYASWMIFAAFLG